MNKPTPIVVRDDAWDDIVRVESWAGEIRVNLIRMIALVAFYARHLFVFVVWPDSSPAAQIYHGRVTWAAALWAVAVVCLHWELAHRRMPAWLKFAAAGFDAVMITLLCCLASALGGSPRTPLALLFFPLIATAPLRLSLRLVYFCTAAAMSGYLVLLAYFAWYYVGFQKYYATPALQIPRSEEAIYLLAMLVTGLLAGQMVRQVRRVAAGHALVAQTPPSPTGTP